jgi:hypothetical protein
MAQNLSNILLLSAVAGYAIVVGQAMLAVLHCRMGSLVGQVAAAGSVGLALMGYGVLGLGLAGVLAIGPLTIAGAIGLMLAIAAHLAVRDDCRPDRRAGLARWVGGGSSVSGLGAGDAAGRGTPDRWAMALRLLPLALALVVFVATLTRALAPPTAGDALCYHLELPKRFVQLERIEYLPWTEQSLFPFLMEMLYGLGLLLSGPVLAQLMSWLVGVLFALVAVEQARLLVGRVAAVWAGLVALSVPAVTNHMSAPLNDLPAALYAALALVAWLRWHRGDGPGWLALAALCAGFGAGVKLTAVCWCACLGAAVCTSAARRAGMRAAVRAAAIFGLLVLASGGIWYARSWWHTGNPVHPYFASVFGRAADSTSAVVPNKSPIECSVQGVLQLPWQATMRPEAFGGRGHQFGVVFLAVLPGLVLVRRAPELAGALGICAAYAAAWFVFRQNLRFLMPVLPVLAAAVLYVTNELRARHRPAWLAAAGAVGLATVLGTAVALHRARPCLAVAWGRESRDEYLARHEPSYAVAQFANRRLPAQSRIVSEDYRAFYFSGGFVREGALRKWLGYTCVGADLTEYWRRQGFTHLLLVTAHNRATAVYDSDLVARLDTVRTALPRAFAADFAGPDGDQRHYELLELVRGPWSVVRGQ